MSLSSIGRFHNARIIARSPYADVYRADDDEGRAFALKVLRLDVDDVGLVDALFTREIAALDGQEFPGVVPLRSSFRLDDGSPVLVFDLVPGSRTLETLLLHASEGKEEREPLWRVREAMRIVKAVSAAHARDIVHRDLKPSNILLDVDRDELLVCDFGVANVLAHRVLNPGGRTLRDLFTRPYAAPEQRLYGEALFPADVHALSIVLTALLSLRAPKDSFRAEEFDGLWARAGEDLLGAGVPAAAVGALRATLREGLVDDPEKRPSLATVANALGQVADHLTPRPVAWFTLSRTAEDKLRELGLTNAQLLTDMQADLAVRLDDDRVKLYGASMLVVVKFDEDDESGLRAIDVKALNGPKMTNDRRNSTPAKLSLRIGRGDGTALVEAARSARNLVQSARVIELLEHAQRVIDLQRERLPNLHLTGRILKEERILDGRDARVTQAAGYTGPAGKRVRVRNARIEVLSVTQVRASEKANLLQAGTSLGFPMPAENVPSLFEDFRSMQVMELASGHQIGRVTAWETEADGKVYATIAFDLERDSPVIDTWQVQDKQFKAQLEQQEELLERIRERRTFLPALPELLTLSSAHVLDERVEVQPYQEFLRNDRPVRDIIERVLASTVSCVQGPPGTGKTTLIVELILQLLARRASLRILVCSQANEAVANALERLQEDDIAAYLPTAPWIVRDVREELREESKHDGLEPRFRYYAAQWSAAAQAKRSTVSSQAIRLALDAWTQDLRNATGQVRTEFASLVQVWGATTARSPRTLQSADAGFWDVVIVDEAAKITLAEVLAPLVDAKRIVLVGDHKQLPPFLEAFTAEQLEQTGLDADKAKRSLFQHLFEDVLPPVHRGEMLKQSRMHPSIGSIVSKLFYQGKLRNNVKEDERPLPAGRFNMEHRVLFAGFCGRDEQADGTSRRNTPEADAVRRVLDALDADAVRAGVRLSVSVITPYKAQVKVLDSRVRRNWKALTEVRAGTVHSFQGRQSDVVIYSLVRTGSSEWRFLADPRLFNVAISRAKALFVLVGDLDGAPGTPLMQALIDELPSENRLPLKDFLNR